MGSGTKGKYPIDEDFLESTHTLLPPLHENSIEEFKTEVKAVREKSSKKTKDDRYNLIHRIIIS